MVSYAKSGAGGKSTGTKVRSSKENGGGKFPMGGTTAMFGKQHAGPKAAGTTGHETKGDGGKFPMGGSGKMFPKGSARKAEPGMSAKSVN